MEIDYRIENCLIYGRFCGVEKQPVIRCTECGSAINEDEDYYDFFGDAVCDNCEFDYVRKNFHRYMHN